MQPFCQICNNSKRPLRFHSAALAICQWCVTAISNADTSPAKIVDSKRSTLILKHQAAIQWEISKLQKRLGSPPKISEISQAEVHRQAESIIRNKEGIFQGLIRTVLNATERNHAIDAEVNRINNELNSTHQVAIANYSSHKNEIESKIHYLKNDFSNIHNIVEKEIQSFLNESNKTASTKSLDVKILRAYFSGLISYERTQHFRPDPLEYEPQKQRVRKRDEQRCICCLRGFFHGELHVHHVIPLSHYGTNTDSNLVTLCHPCHNKQHPGFQVTRTGKIKRIRPVSRFVAINIKTTGLAHEDSIIEISAAKFADGQVEEVFTSLVRSKRLISPSITRLTGITPEMVAEAPHPAVVIQDFFAFISNFKLVLHNAAFDMRYINKYLIYYKYEALNKFESTLTIARKKLPELQNHRLITLIQHFSISNTQFHHAKEDSIATGNLYLALKNIPTPRQKKKNSKQKNRKVLNR